jgi:hypothetical protein
VAIVNQAFARRFFAGQNPLGQRLRYPDNPWAPGGAVFSVAQRWVNELEIVGLAADVKYESLKLPAEPSIYLSSEQWTYRRLTFVARASVDDPESLIPSIRKEIESIDPMVTGEFGLYSSIVAASTARERLGMTLMITFGLIAFRPYVSRKAQGARREPIPMGLAVPRQTLYRTVGAVYDRPRLERKTAGGHRPPLQQKLWSRSSRYSPPVPNRSCSGNSSPIQAGSSKVAEHIGAR